MLLKILLVIILSLGISAKEKEICYSVTVGGYDKQLIVLSFPADFPKLSELEGFAFLGEMWHQKFRAISLEQENGVRVSFFMGDTNKKGRIKDALKIIKKHFGLKSVRFIRVNNPKSARHSLALFFMKNLKAEGTGFEPVRGLLPNRISSAAR